MSINDWNIYVDGGILSSNPRSLVYTDILTPIVGSGSLTITQDLSADFQSIVLVPATAPTGFLTGRLRTLLRLDEMGSPSSTLDVSHVGLLCMQNVENMAHFGEFGGTGQCYGASVSIENGFSTQEVHLYKFSAGIDGSTGELLAPIDSVTLPFLVDQGDVLCLELVWRCDGETITDLGGAYFVVRVGQQADFSDLTDVIIHIDSSPYTETDAEGVWAGFKSGSGLEAIMVTFDQTSLYRTSIT